MASELRLASSDLPDGAERSEKSGLVRIKWTKSMADKVTLDRACEAHEDWLDRNLPI
jgi:hypothetical protein